MNENGVLWGEESHGTPTVTPHPRGTRKPEKPATVNPHAECIDCPWIVPDYNTERAIHRHVWATNHIVVQH